MIALEEKNGKKRRTCVPLARLFTCKQPECWPQAGKLVIHPPKVLNKIFIKSKVEIRLYYSAFLLVRVLAISSVIGARSATVFRSLSILSAMGAAEHWVEVTPLRYRLRWAQHAV
jgi:hypothetical protein